MVAAHEGLVPQGIDDPDRVRSRSRSRGGVLGRAGWQRRHVVPAGQSRCSPGALTGELTAHKRLELEP